MHSNFSTPTTTGHPHHPLFFGWQPILTHGYEGHLVNYFFTAGIAFLLFYVLLRKWMIRRKIQSAFPRFTDIQREIFYSLQSMAVFAGVGLLTVVFQRLHWLHLYFRISDYGRAYFYFSIVVLILLHDTWFYWMHRALHWRPLFKLAHRVHHQSHNPTPWAAFAFHPIEAFAEGIVFPLIALIMPIHPLAAGFWLLYMIVMNVFGHLGFELLPRGFARHWLFRWHNTSVHHNMHHSHVHCNYGLYFNIWDRLMKTNHPDYEDRFERLTKVPS